MLNVDICTLLHCISNDIAFTRTIKIYINLEETCTGEMKIQIRGFDNIQIVLFCVDSNSA